MENKGLIFDIEFDGGPARVSEVKIGTQLVYRVLFKTSRKPLILNEALDRKNNVFWTSIPEGRQAEAELIGPLITKYLNNK